jgi:hypothetical protein
MSRDISTSYHGGLSLRGCITINEHTGMMSNSLFLDSLVDSRVDRHTGKGKNSARRKDEEKLDISVRVETAPDMSIFF